MIEDTLNADAVRAALAGARPTLAAVHALEAGGVNLIPLAMASRLSVELELPMESALVQINRVGHTGSSGWHRLANPALFAGTVVPGTSYLLLDDFVGQGGTLANLKGHIEAKGGKVVGAVVLTGQQRSARLAVSPEVLQDLRDKHGHIENWWRGRFGFGFDAFTESEARYVLNAESAERAIRSARRQV
ncbi:MAG: phosphoribosyltransferase, partial [Burkholderiales bacterium]